MSTTFQDNLAACLNYRQKINEGMEALQSFFQETAIAAGQPVPTPLTIDIVNVERALTKFAAEKIGLVIDKEIFRGAVPPGLDGCCVCVNHLDLGADETIPTVFAQFFCRYADRNRAMTLTANLTRQFPVCGMSVTVADGSVVTTRLIQVLNAEIQSGQADNGKLKTFGLISFKVQL